MMKISLLLLILVFTCFLMPERSLSDCQDCCSRHGDVTCNNGETRCRDGSALSAKCRAKGCNVCSGYKDSAQDISGINFNSARYKSGTQNVQINRPENRFRPSSQVQKVCKIEICECGGRIYLQNYGGCPCENSLEESE